MNGSIILGLVLLTTFVLIKYWGHVKRIASGLSTSIGNIPGSSNKRILWLVLTIVGLVGLYWLYNTDVTLLEAVAWARNHWLFVFILCGILAALIAQYAKGTAKTILQQVLGGTLFLLFIGFPIWVWLVTPGSNNEHSVDKSTLSMSANSDSARVSPPAGYATTFTGDGFTIHCVYTDGHEGIVGNANRPCSNGPMVYQYLHDTSGKPNRATYVFVKP